MPMGTEIVDGSPGSSRPRTATRFFMGALMAVLAGFSVLLLYAGLGGISLSANLRGGVTLLLGGLLLALSLAYLFALRSMLRRDATSILLAPDEVRVELQQGGVHTCPWTNERLGFEVDEWRGAFSRAVRSSVTVGWVDEGGGGSGRPRLFTASASISPAGLDRLLELARTAGLAENDRETNLVWVRVKVHLLRHSRPSA